MFRSVSPDVPGTHMTPILVTHSDNLTLIPAHPNSLLCLKTHVAEDKNQNDDNPENRSGEIHPE